MSNLILGAVKGYGWDVLEPFVISWAEIVQMRSLSCSSAT